MGWLVSESSTSSVHVKTYICSRFHSVKASFFTPTLLVIHNNGQIWEIFQLPFSSPFSPVTTPSGKLTAGSSSQRDTFHCEGSIPPQHECLHHLKLLVLLSVIPFTITYYESFYKFWVYCSPLCNKPCSFYPRNRGSRIETQILLRMTQQH